MEGVSAVENNFNKLISGCAEAEDIFMADFWDGAEFVSNAPRADKPHICEHDCAVHLRHETELNSVHESHCGCEHEHEEMGTEDAVILALGALAIITGFFISDSFAPVQRWIFYCVPYFVCGWPILRQAFKSIMKGKFFNEFTLMGGASLAALCLGELSEALAVMVLYQTGEWLQERAAGKNRNSIKLLLAEKPSVSHVIEEDGIRDMPPEEVQKGMKVLVRPGEKIPVDGVVFEGESRVDTYSITGESVPVRAVSGVKVYGGTICVDGALKIEAGGPFKESEIAKVLDMVEKAMHNKSPVERFITKFAAWYTPVIFGAALLTFIIPPLVLGGSWTDWLYRSLVILMVSCPCALVISVPLGYFGGIGAAARKGILIKGGSVLDSLNDISAVGFDKTGTLTQGVFKVTELKPADGVTETELKEGAAIAEALSGHPLARAVREAFGSVHSDGIEALEYAGKGVSASYKGDVYLAGNMDFLAENGVTGIFSSHDENAGSVICVAQGKRFLGSVIVSDVIREDAADAIAQLRKKGFKSYLLTGDRPESAAYTAKKLGLDGYRASLLPEMKVSAFSELTKGRKALFAGDGVNDAPLLAAAHVGVAMGGLGADIAIEAADAVILNDSPSCIPKLLRIADRTRAIVRENIFGSLAVKGVFLVLGFFGMIGLWQALFADVGVALLAVLNSSRALVSE